MALTPVSELRQTFDVFGQFYEYSIGNVGYKMRGQAKIIRNGLNPQKPDSIVFIANPGSCLPFDENYIYPPHNERDEFVKASSDPTQHQLMRLMERMNYDRLDILNLTDICADNLNEFKRLLHQVDALGIESHSIFSVDRKQELADHLEVNVPIILGWGTNSTFRQLAEQALAALEYKENVYGLKHETHPHYLHPFPLIEAKCIEWLDRMEEQLKEGPVRV